MTDGFLPVDAVLWSLAVALLVLGLWLARGDGPRWDPAVFFGGALTAAFGAGRLPLTEGPVPAGGWDGAATELDPVYDPRERLASDVSWDALAAWTEPARAAVHRRLAGVRLVWVEPPPLTLPDVDTAVVAGPDADPILALLTRPEERLVLAASTGADGLLRLLHDTPALRDRLRAVLLVAPHLDGAWVTTHFTHLGFDVEVAREVPFLTLRTGPDAAAQRLPDPPKPPSGRPTVAVIDLGVLPDTVWDDVRVARALTALCAALG
jgi:hypothetical protein